MLRNGPPFILTLSLLILLILSPLTIAKQQNKQPTYCTAGLIFLKTFNPHNHKQISNETPPSPIATKTNTSTSSPPQTYTITTTYPCESSPETKINSLKKSIPDPFISFYLSDKPINRKKRSPSSHRPITQNYQDYGGSGKSQDYDDDDEEDDEDEDDEDEEEFTVDNEIIDDPLLYPSSHVMLSLPTPTLRYEEIKTSYFPNVVDQSPQQREEISPTTTILLQQTVLSSQQISTPHTENDDLLIPTFAGSGDSPILSTPLYSPTTTDSYSTTYETEKFTQSSPPTQTPSLPHLLHPIQKQLIQSGSPHSFSIPHNTFSPPCSSYELLQPEPWVRVENALPSQQSSIVHFFPTRSQISDYRLTLLCVPNGASAEMFVSVRQRQRSRLYNHEFVIEFGMIRGDIGRVEILNKIVNEIRTNLNSNGSNDLVVLTTELESYPFRISYVNESIISNTCPINELTSIYSNLQNLSGPFIKLESVNLLIPQDNNQCDASIIPTITGVSSSNQGNYGENYPPSIKNQIDKLNGSVGEYLVYHVRDDFCYDPEDGGTRNLNVELRSNELVEIDRNYWLQFDGKNQEFYGLAMGVEAREFVLVCSDRGGKSANDVLELQIHPPKSPPSNYFTEFNINFQSIPFTPKAIRKFIEKLSTLLSPHIQVHSYSESNSHVLFKYFNTTNPSTEAEVTEIRKVLLSDDGPVNKRLYEHFTPEFNVTVVSVVPLRGLLSENNAVVIGNNIGGVVDEGDGDDLEGGKRGSSSGGGRYFDFDSGEDRGGSRGGGGIGGGGIGGGGGKLDIENIVNVDSYSGYLTTYIIPSVLIAIMILLALIIACLLSRKNKYTQASTEDDSSSPNSRVYLKNAKKGVPVIFQDELDEKLFGGEGGGGGGGGRGHGGENRVGGGNIYEQQQPQQPVHQTTQNSANTTPQNTTPSRLTSPTPSTHQHRYNPQNNNTPHHTHTHQPLPPDYQNSISRSMMRNNRNTPIHHNYPAGGIQVYPPQPTPHHHQQYNTYAYSDPYRSPPPIQHPHSYNIDSYQPPPGINYYGIHNSNSGGSGFSERTTASGIIGGGGSGGPQQMHHQQHGSSGSSKMAPPPYVPP